MKASFYKSSITFITIHVNLIGIFHNYRKTMVGHLHLSMKQEIKNFHGFVIIKIKHVGGDANMSNSEYQFWRQDNQPKECYSPWFTVQKLNYIHNNPVEAGIVEKAEDYLYCSAKSYHQQNKNGLLKIEFL